MKLIELISNLWTVRIIISDEKNLFDQIGLKIDSGKLNPGVNKNVDYAKVSNLDSLDDLNPKDKKQFMHWTALFDSITRESNGPMTLDVDVCHYVDKENNIYQIKKKRTDIRLLYFVEGNKIIVCTHVFNKNTDKTPGKEQKKAVSLKEQYLEAQKKTPALFK